MNDLREAESNRRLLGIALRAAVPLWVDRLKAQTPATLEKRVRHCGAVLSERGDALMFRCRRVAKKKQIGTTDVFNCVAEGIAAASLLSHEPWEKIIERFEKDPNACRDRVR